MQIGSYNLTKVHITALGTFFVAILLVWEYLHGEVRGHYVLQQENLPFISNWWGLLLLPALTWVLWGRIQERIKGDELPKKHVRSILFLLFLGLSLGVLISVSFVYNYQFFLSNVLYILIGISFFFPIYYSEFILGFVFGMVYTFGVVLPTVFILVIASFGFLIYRFIRQPIIKIFTQN